MSKRVITLVVKSDDITGEDIPEGQGESFVYAWDGHEYEIDLGDKNAVDVRLMMDRLISRSRRLGKYRPGVQMPKQKAVTTNAPKELPSGDMTPTAAKTARSAFMKEIRLWARENGFPQQGLTGRLIADVREAWNEAHPDRPAPTEASFVR